MASASLSYPMAPSGHSSGDAAPDWAWTRSDKEAMAATADAQPDSPFFTMLPGEVRKLIYVEFWRLHGGALRQHVVVERRAGHQGGAGRGATTNFVTVNPQNRRPATRAAHLGCITDPEVADGRYAGLQASRGAEMLEWDRRLKSTWSTHWRCEEALAERLDGEIWSPFLPVMLTCKRLYLECFDSIFDNITFCLNDTRQAADFLSWWPDDTVRYVDICLRVPTLLTELYYNPDEVKAVVVGGSEITSASNPWQVLCDTLAGMTGLRTLRIWLESEDLRPWHKRVVESRFFAGLVGVRTKGRFTLAIPGLPEEEERGLPGCYLEDVPDAPWVVERGPRVNNWALHFTRVSHLRFSNLQSTGPT